VFGNAQCNHHDEEPNSALRKVSARSAGLDQQAYEVTATSEAGRPTNMNEETRVVHHSGSGRGRPRFQGISRRALTTPVRGTLRLRRASATAAEPLQIRRPSARRKKENNRGYQGPCQPFGPQAAPVDTFLPGSQIQGKRLFAPNVHETSSFDEGERAKK